jgi:hypothetical protein
MESHGLVYYEMEILLSEPSYSWNEVTKFGLNFIYSIKWTFMITSVNICQIRAFSANQTNITL